MGSWLESRWMPLLAGAGWFALIAAGLALLFRYQMSPGTAAIPPLKWPAESSIQRIPGMPTLVLTLHPHCPCSRATVTELAALMTHCQGRVAAHVLFLKPAGFPVDWEKTDLWDNAARLPGVAVSGDPEGIEAARFHASTSGQALLYDAAGKLLFNGGITGARGHSGENAGRTALVALLSNRTTTLRQTPVYGCSLLNSNSASLHLKTCCKK
jgi:hypothetical protein